LIAAERQGLVGEGDRQVGAQASLNSGVPNTGVAGHSMVASVGQVATVGAALSSTVMVWLQVVELLCASVAVQVRLVLLT